VKGQEVVKTTYVKKGNKNAITSFKIEGLEELIESFVKLGEDAISELSEPSVKAAEVVLNRARQKIHDVTGDLRSALKVTKPGKQENKKAFRTFAKVGFGRGAQHGVPLELGHRLVFFGKKTLHTVKERPFLRPAADESKDEVVQIMVDAMNTILDNWGKDK
jgi:HK97 gp10 family phage protein